MNTTIAFQDQIPGNHCFGCGPNNSSGLHLKSYWQKTDTSICAFLPEAHHCSGPANYLNGGILATLIDCHCICTAIAKGYAMGGREIGEGAKAWYVTGKLDVSYLKPVLIDREVELVANIIETKGKKIALNCKVFTGGEANGELCAEGNVVAIKVPEDW